MRTADGSAGRLTVELRHTLGVLELDAAFDVGSETLALVGPSGSGKSSVLRAIAGLLRPAEGRIRLDGRVLLDASAGTFLPPDRRAVGLVFQDAALFPTMTVAQNVAYGVPGPHHGRRHAAGLLLDRFGLSHLGHARPGRLSGGERQRVALARAVAAEPRALLLDEPLSALDPATKAEVAGELHRHLRELELPTVLVSHDFADVLGLADRIAVLEAGRLVQVGTAVDLLEGPASPFVAALTGVNYFRGRAHHVGDVTEVRGAEGALFTSTDEAVGAVGVVVYPWEVALSTGAPEGSPRNRLAGEIRRVVAVGNRARVTVGSRPEIVAEITEESVRRLGLAPGVRVVATWKATGTRLVPTG